MIDYGECLMNRNYQKELDKLLAEFTESGSVPTLLLHSCCAPCSSYCLEYLANYFKIILYYYNPNISPKEEYEKRVEEQKRLIRELGEEKFDRYSISFQEGAYEPEKYYETVKGLEKEPEGGRRCEACFRLRLTAAAKTAKELHADYFTTTLTISPLKSAPLLNALGEEIGLQAGVPFLPSDFKKKNGYKRSIELSARYGLYRQNFCGCVFSKREQESKKALI